MDFQQCVGRLVKATTSTHQLATCLCILQCFYVTTPKIDCMVVEKRSTKLGDFVQLSSALRRSTVESWRLVDPAVPVISDKIVAAAAAPSKTWTAAEYTASLMAP